MIAQCRHCLSLVNYKTASDLLDGHRCPERIAAENKSRLSSVGGPVGDEVYSEYDLDRESLDNSEPPDEGELAEVDTRLLYCRLCGSEQLTRWDDTTPLVCVGCGAIYPGTRSA